MGKTTTLDYLILPETIAQLLDNLSIPVLNETSAASFNLIVDHNLQNITKEIEELVSAKLI